MGRKGGREEVREKAASSDRELMHLLEVGTGGGDG